MKLRDFCKMYYFENATTKIKLIDNKRDEDGGYDYMKPCLVYGEYNEIYINRSPYADYSVKFFSVHDNMLNVFIEE